MSCIDQKLISEVITFTDVTLTHLLELLAGMMNRYIASREDICENQKLICTPKVQCIMQLLYALLADEVPDHVSFHVSEYDSESRSVHETKTDILQSARVVQSATDHSIMVFCGMKAMA